MKKTRCPTAAMSPPVATRADCGHEYSNQSRKSLPPCPDFNVIPHPKRAWKILTGAGDAEQDPYPNGR